MQAPGNSTNNADKQHRTLARNRFIPGSPAAINSKFKSVQFSELFFFRTQ